MNIDIRTLIMIVGITNVLQILAIFHQYKVNKSYQGIGWWLLGFTAMTLGSVFLSLRDLIPIALLTIIIANTLILLGPIFLYIGIMRFLDKKENRAVAVTIMALFIIPFTYYTYLDNNITLRTVIVYAAAAIVTLLTAQSLFRNNIRSFAASATFNAVIFLIHGCTLAFRALVTLTVDPVGGLFTATMMQTASFLFLFIQGVLLTFGLIVMVNQRLNAENLESKENLEQIFNTSPDAVLVTRLSDGYFVAINDGFTAITGYTRAELIGKSTLEVNIWTNPADRQKLVSVLNEKGFCENMEAVFKRKDGSLFPGMISAKIIALQGAPHIISETRDVTKRNQAEAALRESEALQNLLLDNLPAGVVIVDPATRIIERVNDHVATLFGAPVDHLLGHRCHSLLCPASEGACPVCDLGMTVDNSEREMLRQDGSRLPILKTVKRIQLNGQEKLLECFVDVSERKRAEQALRQSEEKHRQLIENSHDIIYTLTADGVFSFVSPAWTVLLGHPLDQVVGKTFQPFVHPDDFAKCMAWLKKVIATGQRQEGIEYRVMHINGTWRWHTSSAVPLRDQKDVVIGFEGTARDITERKRNEDFILARLELLDFSASHTLAEVLQRTLDSVGVMTGSPIGFYHFVNSDQKTLSLQAWSTRTVKEFCKADGYGMHYPIEQAGVWVDCVHTQKPVIHNDYASLPHRKGMPEGHAPVIRELVVPILRAGKIVSILGVGNKATDYAEEDVNLVAFFADVAWEVAERKRAEASLVESEARYAVTLAAVNDGLWDWHVPSGRAFFSPLYYAMIGYDDGEFVASYVMWRGFVHPEDIDRVEQDLKKSIESGGSFAIDLRLKMKSGRFRWVAIRGKAVEWDVDGKVLRMVGTLSDITERKLTESYRSLSTDVLEIINESNDFQNSIRDILSAVKKVTGYDAVGIRLQSGEDYPYYDQNGFPGDFLLTENSLVVRDPDGSICPGSDGTVCLECTCGLVISGKADPNHPLFTPGGSFWTNDSLPLLDLPANEDPRHHPRNKCIHHGYASFALVPIRTRQKIIGLLQLNDRRKDQFSLDAITALESIANHIGEALMRKQAEDALRESEEKYRNILANISEGYLEHDLAGNFTFANDAACTITGYTKTEIVGINYRKIVTAQTAERMFAIYNQIYQTGKEETLLDFEIIRRDGSIIVLELNAMLMRNNAGEPIGYRVMGRDVTLRRKAEEDLRHSEEKYRSILENISEGYFESNVKGDVIFTNDAGLAMMGYKADEKEKLYQTNYRQFTTAATKQKMQEAYRRVYQTDIPSTMGDYDIIHQDGAIRVHQLSIGLMKDPAGNKIGFRAVARDITERKRTEEELRQITERLKLATLAGGVGIWDYDVIHNRLVWDNQMYHLYGITQQIFGGAYEAWQAGLHPEDRQRGDEEIQLALRGEKEFDTEFRVVWPDGTIHNIRALAFVKRDESGDPLRMVGTNWDITDQKQTESALRESEERFRQLAEVFPETIFEADFSGRLTYANKHGFDTFRMTPSDLDKGVNILSLVIPTDRSKAQQRMQNRRLGMSGGFLEYKARRSDGTEFDAMAYTAPMTRQGKAAGFRGFILDITERKQAEVALLEAKEKAEEANQAKSEFLSIMSHEIRTPLNAIIGMSELLSETALDNDQKHYVKTFTNAGESLLGIINDILDYSKIEAGKIELESADFNLVDTVEKVSEIMTMQAHRKNIALIVNILPDVPYYISGDQQRLRQVLLNLIGNAIKFTEEGEITVTLEKTREALIGEECAIKFSVRDTGIGIPQDKLQHIFERFSQADSSVTRKFGGTGLGLTISKKLTELMGGQLHVESKVGQGSNFYFTLKFTTQKDHEEKPQHPAVEMRELNILLVEDAENNRMLIRSYLKNTPFHIEEAINGQIAVDKVKTQHYDIILMDMQMPVMDGYTATREIRKWESENGVSPVPIIALTAHVFKEDIDKSLTAGCNGHLTKPVKKLNLIESIVGYVNQGENK